MDRRRIAALLVLLALVGGGLLFLWKSIGASSPTDAPAIEVAGSTAAQAHPSRDTAPLEAPPDAAHEDHTRTETVPTTASGAASREENFALEGAHWIEGTVRIPAGSPSDESLAVWVLAWPKGGLKTRLDTQDTGSMIASLQRDAQGTRWSRRTVDAQGRFKAPLPADESRALLLVDGRFLYLPEAKAALEADLAAPITLEPALGACLSVRCVPPPSAGADETAAGAPVSLRGFSMGSGGPRRGAVGYVQRSSVVDDDSRFELRALPPDLRYMMSVTPKRLATASKTELALAPGQTTELVLDLKRGARVSGRVLDEQQAPVAGVKVSSSARGGGMFGGGASDDRNAVTGADGTYEIAGLRAGKQRLSATLESWADGQSDEITLKDDQRLTGVDIVLPRGEKISGRVTWPDGRPAKGAGVQALESSEKRPRFGPAKKVRGGKADELGDFNITGLDKGLYLVTASAHELEKNTREEKTADANVENSSLTEKEDGAIFDELRVKGLQSKKATLWVASQPEVKSGSTDLALVLHAPPGLAGQVVDESGAVLREFSVEVNPDWQSTRVSIDRGMHVQAFKSEDGSFRVDDVNDGDWTVTVKAKGYSQLGAPPGVSVPQSGDPLIVKMVVAATISGTVLDPSGKPIPDADVELRPQGETNRFQGGRENGSAKSDNKGLFTLRDVSAGNWQLSASAEHWAKSEPVPVPIAAGQNLVGVELHMRIGGAIVGEVWDARGAHAAGRHVQIFSMSAGDNRQAPVDATGSFKAEHLTPGAYQVMLEPSEADQAALTEKAGNGEQPDMADVFSKLKMTSCEIKDGEVTHVVLGAPPKAPVKLSGRITQGGEPVTKVTLVVLNEGGALLQSLKFGKVDGNGHYEVTIDKPGEVVLVVTKEFGRSKGVDFYITVPEVPEFTADLALSMSAIRGSVRGPDGAPLAKVPVQLMRDASSANILMMDGPPSENTDENGRFEFKDLNPGTYAVAAGGVGGGNGAFGNDDTSFGRAVRGGLKVERDRVMEGIDLRLSAPAKLSGTVRDASGSAVSGATVYVRDAQGELLTRFSTCTSDASGKFVYKGVAPGVYTLSARTKTLAARDGGTVSVHEGANTDVDITLELGTLLRVSATDKDDKPLKAGISVKDERGYEVGGLMALDAMQEAFMQGVSSTEQKIGPLPSGKYVVTATAPDGKTAKKAVTLKGQDERKLIVRVE